jgi:hypothetical protein
MLPVWVGAAEAACGVDAWDTRLRRQDGALLRVDRITLAVAAEVAACASWTPPADFGALHAARWTARGGALRARRGTDAVRVGPDGERFVWMPGLFEGDRVQLVTVSAVTPGAVWAPGALGPVPWARLRWAGPPPPGQPRRLLRGPLPADGAPDALRIPLLPSPSAPAVPATPRVLDVTLAAEVATVAAPDPSVPPRHVAVVDGQVWLADLVGPLVAPAERWLAWPVAGPLPMGEAGPGYDWACTVEEQRTVCRFSLHEPAAAAALARSLGRPVAVAP